MSSSFKKWTASLYYEGMFTFLRHSLASLSPVVRQLLAIVSIAGIGVGTGAGAARLIPAKSVEPTTVASIQATTTTSPTPAVTPTPTPAVSTSPKPAAKSSPAPAKPAVNRQNFTWGISVNIFPFADQNEEFLPEQYRLAKELGVKSVRIDFAPNNPSASDAALAKAREAGLEVVMIIPFGPRDIFSDPALDQSAYDYVAKIVKPRAGQVGVWQLATEPASVAIKSAGHHGIDKGDYVDSRYQAVKTWLLAASRAVKDNDPNTRRLINDQWVHTGFFDRFMKEGGDKAFEILGWNWFSDMGSSLSRPTLDAKKKQTYELLAKLKSFGKPIWLTEVNRRRGSADANEKAQADFIESIAKQAYADRSVAGLFVFNLIEDLSAPPAEQGYSIVNVDRSTRQVVGPKQAFHRYQSFIRDRR